MKPVPSRLLPLGIAALVLGALVTLSLPKNDSLEAILGKIPVQSGGRVKPFESFAREAALSITGKAALNEEGMDVLRYPPTILVWEWISNPDVWSGKNFLSVKNTALRKELGLQEEKQKASPELVFSSPLFLEKLKEALEKQQKKTPLLLIEKKRIELFDKARLFQVLAEGELPGFFPNPEDPRKGWFPLAGLKKLEPRGILETAYDPAELWKVESALAELVTAFREKKGDPGEAAQKFSLSLEHLLDSRQIRLDQTKIRWELFYNQIHPFQWAWIFYLTSALLWFFLKERSAALSLGFFLAGFLAHTLGFALRCFIAGRPPVSNMYESVLWVAWAAVLFSSVLSLIYRRRILLASAAWVAAFALLIGESFPAVLDPSLSPLVPVLRNNYWLTVHVLTITLSYGAFALAWGIAHVQLFNFAFHPARKKEQAELAESLYRALQIGVVLLAAGTILGGVWANDSWGRFWGWDPKETWALIALFGYLVVLHGRFGGWLGSFGTALGTIFAFLGILMAWYGVNFILAAGFHSYGFGEGGLPYVLAVVLLDLVFVSALAFRYNTNLRKGSLIGQ